MVMLLLLQLPKLTTETSLSIDTYRQAKVVWAGKSEEQPLSAQGFGLMEEYPTKYRQHSEVSREIHLLIKKTAIAEYHNAFTN